MKIIRSFLSETDGVTAVEFGLVIGLSIAFIGATLLLAGAGFWLLTGQPLFGG